MKSSRLRILRAMLKGQKITPLDANRIGRTTEGGRRIREIRIDYPVIKERIENTRYFRYYIDPVWLEEYNQKSGRHRMWGLVKSLFL